jgi:hypothetical protein
LRPALPIYEKIRKKQRSAQADRCFLPYADLRIIFMGWSAAARMAGEAPVQ